MSTELANVKLLGKNTTNPGIPRSIVKGTLYADTPVLQFRSNVGRTHYEIPWESIDVCEVEVEKVVGMAYLRVFVCAALLPFIMNGVILMSARNNTAPAFLGLPLTLLGVAAFIFFAVIISNVVTIVVIKHWNEEYGYDATVRFAVGQTIFSYGRAHDLVREIWGYRGGVRSRTHKATRVHLSE